MANVPLKSIKFPGLSDTYTIPQIDTVLTSAGKAADAKATGDAIAKTVKIEAQSLTDAQKEQARTNIGAGEPVAVDATLATAGAAADAKKTGDEIAGVKSAFGDIADTADVWENVSTDGIARVSGYKLSSQHGLTESSSSSVLYMQISEAGTYRITPSTTSQFAANIYDNISASSDIKSANWVEELTWTDSSTRICTADFEAGQWLVCTAFSTGYSITVDKLDGTLSTLKSDTPLTAAMVTQVDGKLQTGWQTTGVAFERGGYASWNSKDSRTNRVRTVEPLSYPYPVTLLASEGFYIAGYFADGTLSECTTYRLPANTPVKLYVRRINEVTETADVDTFASKVRISSAFADIERFKSTYTDVSMFEKVGVCGDSYAAGGGIISGVTALTWGKNLERQAGVDVSIYARSGQSVVDWNEDETYGLPALLAGDECGLYWMQHGINGTSTAEALGTADDMSANPRPATFYGQYTEAVEQIKAAFPDARIVLASVTGSGYALSQTTYAAVNEAIRAIAAYCEVPVIDITEDDFYKSLWYSDNIRSNHPTAMQCAGMAAANRRLIAKCIMDNPAYFLNYGNTGEAVE